jgi:nucleoside triphosphate diphosphatase
MAAAELESKRAALPSIRLDNPQPSSDLAELVQLMAALRTPVSGCPWDLEQNFSTIAPYTIEEAHEVAEAITRGDMEDLCDELGDLLLQVVFHARMAEEAGAFAMPDVIRAISTKLIRRHPHVFTEARNLAPDAVKQLWGEIKRAEKAEKATRRGLVATAPARTLDGVPAGLPATQRAVRIQQKAAMVGFDWNEPAPVLDKIAEELGECAAALRSGDNAALEGEIGDLIFAAINLARHAGIDPDMALARTNQKFVSRFGMVEDALAKAGSTPKEASLEEMERLWVAAKQPV